MRETNSKVTLSGVPETMLQTVYARAKETQNRGAVRDEKAVEIIRRLDYDFSLADKDSAMSCGVIARTIVLDKLVKTYLSAHPGSVAVNIACGLDTRCYRMQGYQHWYNLDLPETIAVREKLLPENGKISQIAMSAMDDWGGMIRESGDALVIIEGLTMYLSEADVQRIFDVIARRFPRVTVLVEVMNPLVVRNFKEKSIEGSHAKFTWGVRDGQALAALLPGFQLVEEHSLIEGMAEFLPIYKVLGKIPEEVCIHLLEKYQAEKKSLAETVTALEQKAQTVRDDAANADEFIRRLKAYLEVPELTREMCLELIEYITLDAYVEGQPREIYIYYKLLDEPLKDKRSLFKGVFTLFTQHMKVCYYLARRQRFLSTVICFRSIRSKLAMLLQTL